MQLNANWGIHPAMHTEQVVTSSSMLRASNFMSGGSCIPDLKAATKVDVLRALTHHISSTHPTLAADEIFSALWEREELGSTGIESGIAIPHGRLKKLAHPILTIGKTETPIEFDAIDGMKTDLFFVVLAPSSGNEHLRLLAQLARLFQTTGFAEQLRYCFTADEMYRCLLQWEAAITC